MTPIYHGNHWRMRPSELAQDDEFIEKCLKLWDDGKDSKEASQILLQYESVVERATRFGRERRRAQEEEG